MRSGGVSHWLTVFWLGGLLVLLPGVACARQAPQLSAAEAAFRSGKYDEAITAFARLAEADPSSAAARRGWVRALMEVGRYDEAVSAARAPGIPEAELANALGEALYARGDVAGAEAAFRRSVEAKAEDALTAELNLAVLLYNRGERDAAMRQFDRFIDVYNASESLTASALTAVGTAVRFLGARDPQLFRDALKAYDEAMAEDPSDPEPRVRLGQLFLDKYNSPDAQETLREVLSANPRHPRALLEMARAKHFDGSSEALDLVRKSLEVNPNLIPARLLLARLLLEQENDAAAEAEIRKALAVNPASLEALSMLAALHFVRGEHDAYGRVSQQVQQLNPRYAELYTTVGDAAVRRRLYDEASELGERAVALDPTAWSAFGMLGLNELRRGRAEAARRHLEQAFKGDPYNVWTKNTLDLLDTYPRYRTVRTPRFELFLHEDEADLLSLYAAEIAEEAYRNLSERYGYQPPSPIRVEFYPNHADFSVRSVGLAGLGALGVAFGNVLAMDSPSAREKGQFNWGSTLWHEITHAVTLGLSDHRVPRWFTEGLSVHEERRARPGWGSETGPTFLLAYAGGELPPASRLSEVFVRPESPEQLGHGYHLASLVVEWMEEAHGFQAVLGFLRGYAQGRTTEQLLGSELRSDPERFDKDFDAWIRRRYATQLRALGRLVPGSVEGGEFTEAMVESQRLIEQGRLDEARRAVERAAELFPEYSGASAPHAILAEIHLKQGNQREAAEALKKLTALDENAFAANLKLAEILEGTGDAAGAAEALERIVYIFPMELELHGRLAQLYERAGDHRRAIRERRAVVALNPVDRAEALYQLALALERSGDRAAAKQEVLRALEASPRFDKAQELLLRLSSGSREDR